MARGVYETVGRGQTVATAITILEIDSPATTILKILRAYLDQSNITVSTASRIGLLRKTAAITGTASPPTPSPLDGSAASGVTTLWIATAEGTDGVVIKEDGFNYLNGWLWIPGDREAVIVPPSGRIALKFGAAPATASWNFGIVHDEIG